MIKEALKWHQEGKSIPQRAAKPPRKHLFCDPERKQRHSLGIFQENDLKIQSFPDPPMPKDEIQRQVLEGHRRRERFWLGHLLEVSESEWPVLFICEADHVESFSKLLDENGLHVKRLNDHWKP